MNKNISAEISWLDRDIKRFKDLGYIIPKVQRKIYSAIRDHWVHGKTVVDIGCSIGIGANILSHEARHVQGLEINEESVRFCSRLFSRPNLDVTQFDIENPTDRPMSKFDVITMIEVIEHLEDPMKGIDLIKRFMGKDSVAFVTVPNTAHQKVKDADAKNELHIQHWTPGEFYNLMIKHFEHVTMFSSYRLNQWEQGETTDGNDTTSRVIIVKLEGVKNV